MTCLSEPCLTTLPLRCASSTRQLPGSPRGTWPRSGPARTGIRILECIGYSITTVTPANIWPTSSSRSNSTPRRIVPRDGEGDLAVDFVDAQLAVLPDEPESEMLRPLQIGVVDPGVSH